VAARPPCSRLLCSVAPRSATDTIYALSTAPGVAALAVFRVSGPHR
jgi:hypothetical protein